MIHFKSYFVRKISEVIVPKVQHCEAINHQKIKLITFLLLLFAESLTAQVKHIYVETIAVREKTFTGSIGGKYPITLHVEFAEFSKEHSRMYSVKGWYYYEKAKTKIPFVGFFDGSLTLYVFDKSKENIASIILNQSYQTKDGFMSEIEHYLNMKGYLEKFYISNESEKCTGTWESGKNKFMVELETNDLTIFDNEEYLCFGKNGEFNKIDLHRLKDIYGENYSFVGSKANATGVDVLLKYDYPTNYYINGRCGAGIEGGYLLLKFDADFTLKNYDLFELESCDKDIYFEEVQSNQPDFKKFNIESISSEGSRQETLYVNEQNTIIYKVKR